MRPYFYLICAATLAVGCNKAKEAAATTAPVPPTTAEAKPAAPETPPTGTTPKPAETPTAKLADLPENLRNDAFDYEGLGVEQPQKYKFTMSGVKDARTGTDQFTLIKIDGGKAKFHFSQVGGIEGDQSAEMSLETDGLYAESYSPQELKTPHVIELPAKLTVGSSWKDHMSISSMGSDFTLDSEYKVVGSKSVTVPAGTFDTLYISGVGKGTIAGKGATVKTDSWFGKGKGVIKQVLTISQDKKVTTISKELDK